MPDLAICTICDDHLPLIAVNLFLMLIKQPDDQLELGPTVPASCIPEHCKNRNDLNPSKGNTKQKSIMRPINRNGIKNVLTTVF